MAHALLPAFADAGCCPAQIPPCVFGSEAEGLLPPPGGEKGLPMDTPLFSRKLCHADYGHHGEMSLWQSYGVLV